MRRRVMERRVTRVERLTKATPARRNESCFGRGEGEEESEGECEGVGGCGGC